MTTLPAPLYLVEITVYDPSLGTTKVLRYASGQGFTTKPSESPASTCYDARIKQPVDISRTMFSGNSTMSRSTVGIGDLILSNDDGGLDALVDYGFDGQSVVVRRTTTMNPSYPSDFTSYTLTATGAEFTSSEVRLQLRDRQQLLDVPLQTTKYAGNNSLPSGLEGVADLKGKPKPVCYGVVKNVPAPCVNTSKLIYQVNDGAISSVDAVYDRGISLLAGLGSWTAQTTGLVNTQRALVYSGSLYVVAGDGGELATSPDGVTWTTRTSGFGGDNILGLAYGNGVYVAVGSSGKLFSSADAITWTSRTSQFGATTIRGVCYGNGLFVAVGDSGTMSTSPDGVTWTLRTSAFGAVRINGVAYGNGLYVAVGTTGRATTSTDGTTWTLNTTGFDSGTTYNVVVYSNRKWVAGAANGSTVSSVDGLTWSGRTSGFAGFATSTLAKSITGLAYGNGTYVFCGPPSTNGGTLASSSDGDVWASRSISSSADLSAAVYGNGKFLVAGVSGAVYLAASNSTYASQADLLDDTKAPAAGTFKYFSDATGSYFRLGSKPDGIVTADVTQGATAADRTAAQLFKLGLARAGLTSSSTDYSSSDITALDTANSAVLGFWTMDEMTVADFLDQVTRTVGAWWAADNSGVLRVKQLTAPSGTAAVSFTANDLKRPLERLTPSDETKGIPTYKVTHRWGRYYQTITTDLAAGVDDASRAQFAQEWRDVTDSDSSVLTAHPLSVPLVVESLFSAASDASTEATRVLTLRKARRGMYEAVVELNDDTKTLDLGNVVSLTYSRFGMSGGVLFRVLDLRPNASRKELTMTLWGGS